MRVKTRHVLMTVLFLLAVMGSGCTPYKSSFRCADTYNGKCLSVPDAYKDSVQGKDGPPPAGKKAEEVCPAGNGGEGTGGSAYNKALLDEYANLLKEPETPLVVPPKVVRVLLLPYTGSGNNLYMLRYVYFFADEPRWIMGVPSKTGVGE